MECRTLYSVLILSFKSREKSDTINAYHQFVQTARKYPNEIYIEYENEKYTWKQAEEEARRVGHWALSMGLKRGDTIAVVMTNRPEFIFMWLGLMSVGVVPAFINYNLRLKPLVHSIRVSDAPIVLFDTEITQSIAEIRNDLPPAIQLWSVGEEDVAFATGAFKKATRLAQPITEHPLELMKGTKFNDPSCYIYTSGTTGMPKPATVTHAKVISAQQMWTTYNKITQKEKVYTAMPLYHSSAALLCVGMSWLSGCTVCIGHKFSVKTFWDEVRRHDATVIQYIGEICRYLLTAPPSPNDKNHRVWQAYGNGMRPDVWERFRERFGVKVISEFYAATEGNISLFNYNEGPHGAGAVGHFGGFARGMNGTMAIIRVDPLTEEPVRDTKGNCVRCAYNEPGELVTVIDNTHPQRAFAGYKGNAAATQKKILQNVFKKGDMYFRTGDLLKMDEDGYFYFGDRLGDTFRWKSENVSTAEVSQVMGEYPGVDEANVYGVLVPKHDGRAGCAAIPATSRFDFEGLATHVSKNLPKYAVPHFIRIVPAMETTGTMKQQKVELRMQGVDVTKVKDPVYWLVGGKYRLFTPADWKALNEGKHKL